MALVHTPAPALGSKCPDFSLPAVFGGKTFSLKSFEKSDVLVVMFICNHCPYVKAVEDRLIELAKVYRTKGVSFVGICSNDATEYPEDSFENLGKRAKDKGYSFPYLHYEDQKVAHAFGAVCTPDFFIYDQKRQLAYRGRLDDSWKDPALVKKQDLADAIECILENEAIAEQIPSMGCSIKWKSAR
jgi:thiol-disulfide isomerase/thioredoxin